MFARIRAITGRRRARRIAGFIAPRLDPGDSVLDLGCGNLLVADFIRQQCPVHITGIDVINTNLTDLPLVLYDGHTIPFQDKSLDATYAAFVLHHTDHSERLLRECLRVTRNTLLVLEDVYRNRVELWLTKALDFTNKLRAPDMPVPFNFRQEAEWTALFNQLGAQNVAVEKVYPLPLRPTRHRLFRVSLL